MTPPVFDLLRDDAIKWLNDQADKIESVPYTSLIDPKQERVTACEVRCDMNNKAARSNMIAMFRQVAVLLDSKNEKDHTTEN